MNQLGGVVGVVISGCGFGCVRGREGKGGVGYRGISAILFYNKGILDINIIFDY